MPKLVEILFTVLTLQ